MREIGFFFDGFRFLTAKQKTFLRENQIFINLLLFLSSMFEYEGFAPEINTDFINSITASLLEPAVEYSRRKMEKKY